MFFFCRASRGKTFSCLEAYKFPPRPWFPHSLKGERGPSNKTWPIFLERTSRRLQTKRDALTFYGIWNSSFNQNGTLSWKPRRRELMPDMVGIAVGEKLSSHELQWIFPTCSSFQWNRVWVSAWGVTKLYFHANKISLPGALPASPN